MNNINLLKKKILLLLVILFTFCNTKNKTEISDTAKQEFLYKIDIHLIIPGKTQILFQ